MINWQFISLLICILFMWFLSFASIYSMLDKIATKIALVGLMLIDHYFKSKEEHVKKMLQDGLDKRFMN